MSNFTIEDYTPAPTANEYDEAVAALIDAGEGKSLVIPGIRPEDVSKAKRRFGEAANRADKSARLRETIPSDDRKTVGLRFTLSDRITQNRKPKDEDGDVPAAEDSTVAPEETSEDTAEETPAKGSRRK